VVTGVIVGRAEAHFDDLALRDDAARLWRTTRGPFLCNAAEGRVGVHRRKPKLAVHDPTDRTVHRDALHADLAGVVVALPIGHEVVGRVGAPLAVLAEELALVGEVREVSWNTVLASLPASG
jgi:hypothetical protein